MKSHSTITIYRFLLAMLPLSPSGILASKATSIAKEEPQKKVDVSTKPKEKSKKKKKRGFVSPRRAGMGLFPLFFGTAFLAKKKKKAQKSPPAVDKTAVNVGGGDCLHFIKGQNIYCWHYAHEGEESKKYAKVKDKHDSYGIGLLPLEENVEVAAFRAIDKKSFVTLTDTNELGYWRMNEKQVDAEASEAIQSHSIKLVTQASAKSIALATFTNGLIAAAIPSEGISIYNTVGDGTPSNKLLTLYKKLSPKETVTSLTFLGEDKIAYTQKNVLYVQEISSGIVKYKLNPPTIDSNINAVAYDHERKVLVIADENDNMSFYTVDLIAQKYELTFILAYKEKIRPHGLAFIPGKSLTVWKKNYAIDLWNLIAIKQSKKEVKTLAVGAYFAGVYAN